MDLNAMLNPKPLTQQENACECSDCGREYRRKDCPSYEDSESWELPTVYMVYECPLCESGGCVERFNHVGKLRLLWLAFRLRLSLFLKTFQTIQPN